MKNPSPSIAIIGAGLTGLAVGRALVAAGHSPTIFDKSRGIGGRMATRRAEDDLTFDHGAPFVTAAYESFRATLTELVSQDAAAVWAPTGPWRGRKPWHVGCPGMSSLPRALAQDLDVKTGREVFAIAQEADGWQLQFTGAQPPVSADLLVVTTPAPQAVKLLGDHRLATTARDVKMVPCLTMMTGFDRQLGLLFDTLKAPSPELSWIIRNASKPGRTRLPEAWVVHASPEWSAEHLELDKQDFADLMFTLLAETVEVDLPKPIHLSGHRWRYAFASNPLGETFLASPEDGLFVGGDWCLGPLAEDAWRSGQALAAAIIDNL